MYELSCTFSSEIDARRFVLRFHPTRDGEDLASVRENCELGTTLETRDLPHSAYGLGRVQDEVRERKRDYWTA